MHGDRGQVRARDGRPLLLLAVAAVAVCVAVWLGVRLLGAWLHIERLAQESHDRGEAAQRLKGEHAELAEKHERLRIEALALAESVEEALAGEVEIDLAKAIAPGMNYCNWDGRYGSEESHKMIARLADIGFRRLILTPTYYQHRADSTDIYPDRRHSREATSPTIDQLASDIQLAHELGMEVGLKMHVDPEDETPRGDIKLRSAADHETWMASYRRVLFPLADLAKAHNVEHFYVGCELSGVANPPHTAAWRGLVRELRARLPSATRLTYASQHHNTYNVQWLGDLDYIGINAWPYFRPTRALSVAALKHRWRSVIYMVHDRQVDFFDYVRFIARMFDKPIVLTELGCQSKIGAAHRAVVWNEEGKPAPLVQAYFYEGFFAALREDMTAFARRHPGQRYPIIGVDSWNCVVDARGPENPDYTIVGKPAEMIYRRLFARPAGAADSP